MMMVRRCLAHPFADLAAAGCNYHQGPKFDVCEACSAEQLDTSAPLNYFSNFDLTGRHVTSSVTEMCDNPVLPS